MNVDTLNLILHEEGGYVNHKNDSGGETIFGITRKNYPSLSLWTEVDSLKNTKKLSGKLTNTMISLRNKYINEISVVYEKYFNNTAFLVEKWNDNPNAEAFIVGFAVNAGVKRCLTVANNSDTYLTFKNNVIAYYKKIAVGKNECFKKGWENRLRNLSGDKSIIL